jgi:protein phosphatase
MIWHQPHRVNLADMLPRHPQEEPVNSPGHDTIPVENREGAETRSGHTERLSWGARTDIGLVRSHNEDSFLVQPPLFAVCDGMGGHAAGEVASSIAVQTIGAQAPIHADDILLGAAVEAANAAVIEGAATGKGKPGMGCTASCVLIENNKMAIAHVGDSRIYLLHHGTLVRLTHDHSYVEELVDAGEITADEARVHPSRSIITRALGSDPDMYADHFTLDVSVGDRLIVCSDGLSSMVEDSEIEAIAVSSVTPQSAADNLTSAALSAGGHDNITVIVVDVSDDGAIEAHRTMRKRLIRRLLIFGGCILAAMVAVGLVFVNSSWYPRQQRGNGRNLSGDNRELHGHSPLPPRGDHVRADLRPPRCHAAESGGRAPHGERRGGKADGRELSRPDRRRQELRRGDRGQDRHKQQHRYRRLLELGDEAERGRLACQSARTRAGTPSSCSLSWRPSP